jgi:hypothetical protein
MDKKDWIITIITVVLVVFVILFWNKFVIKDEEFVSADHCEINEDCVWAVNPGNCCIVPIPMNKKIVELDENYTIYQEGIDYLRDYPKNEQCFSEDGHSLIAGCAILEIKGINGPLECVNNKCMIDNFNNVDEKVRCRQDGDCILAVNLSTCCYNFFSTNLETVEKYTDIITYEKNQTMVYYDSFGYSVEARKKCTGCPAIYMVPPDELKCTESICTPYFY